MSKHIWVAEQLAPSQLCSSARTGSLKSREVGQPSGSKQAALSLVDLLSYLYSYFTEGPVIRIPDAITGRSLNTMEA